MTTEIPKMPNGQVLILLLANLSLMTRKTLRKNVELDSLFFLSETHARELWSER